MIGNNLMWSNHIQSFIHSLNMKEKKQTTAGHYIHNKIEPTTESSHYYCRKVYILRHIVGMVDCFFFVEPSNSIVTQSKLFNKPMFRRNVQQRINRSMGRWTIGVRKWTQVSEWRREERWPSLDALTRGPDCHNNGKRPVSICVFVRISAFTWAHQVTFSYSPIEPRFLLLLLLATQIHKHDQLNRASASFIHYRVHLQLCSCCSIYHWCSIHERPI